MRLRPSLARRLTLGFVIVNGLGLFLLMLALWPFARVNEEDHVGPDVAVAFLAHDIVTEQSGFVRVPADGDIWKLARKSPDLWFVVSGEVRQWSFGRVPEAARPLLAALPNGIKSAELRNIGAAGLTGEVSVGTIDGPAGRMIITAGGIEPRAVTFPLWLLYIYREEFFWAPLLTAAVTLLGAVVAIPILLRGVRPTARAVTQLDPSDLTQRLPEKGIVGELLPIVRAFNGALDRLQEGFERRKRFIADVAHELRTPLAVLSMHIEALPDADRKPDLQRTVFRLGQMVGQMLDSERLALAGRQRQPVDLVELSRASVAEVAPLAVANGYELAFEAEQERVTVTGDAHAISRAVANLLGNAVAHGGGSGLIEVRVKRNRSIEVSDQGPGVAIEARSRIFEPFHRERWDKDGCGLGLHLVSEVMVAHGGQASIQGSPSGAVFRLEFPPP
jgi:signal transduction histidine kinase